MSTVYDRLHVILERQSLGMASEFTPEKYLREDLHCDSLDLVELTMGVEDEFALEIPDEDMEGFKTIKDVADYVTMRLAKKHQQSLPPSFESYGGTA